MALEFHKWRDQFPGWFQSQFGNKLIYTGAGAADIVLSSRMNLPGKVQARSLLAAGCRSHAVITFGRRSCACSNVHLEYTTPQHTAKRQACCTPNAGRCRTRQWGIARFHTGAFTLVPASGRALRWWLFPASLRPTMLPPIECRLCAQIECDGKPIVLPKDTEGILLLNIPSYMGGVDLWASGLPADGHASRRSRATTDDNAKQSFCDRRLEVQFCMPAPWHVSGSGSATGS